jgi:UDPglucose 6-dehydrogenase
MRVAVVGTGHVGLVTSVALSTMGHEVVGLDVDEEKLALLRRGIAPFHEAGLQEGLEHQLADGSLRFTDQGAEAVEDATVIFVCVGTPSGTDGEADLRALELAGITIAKYARDGVVIAEKSTVPAGTAELLRRTVAREGGGLRFDVASNPEFLREGQALQDSLDPDRIVIGVESERSASVLRAVYEPLTRRGALLIETDIRTAELAKHASNSFLALKISYANALARVCERAGADVEAIAEVMGADSRIGRAFLNAGLGYGGYCLPKDVMSLERLSARLGYDWPLLREVDRLNREAMESTIAKVRDAAWNIANKRIAVLGLAFKPGTDDARLSPALELARRLLAEGASVVACDPLAAANAKEELPELEIAPDAYTAATGSHCLVVATDWEEFADLDLSTLRQVMAYPIVVDARNIFDPQTMRVAGFSYYPTGRPPILDEAIHRDADSARRMRVSHQDVSITAASSL